MMKMHFLDTSYPCTERSSDSVPNNVLHLSFSLYLLKMAPFVFRIQSYRNGSHWNYCRIAPVLEAGV